MNNKGYVTIFISMVLVVMLVVALAVIRINRQSYARTKASTSLSSAMSGELANYNRYIFDRYHILLLDKNANGAGEGSLEQAVENSLSFDLGEEFSVNSVELAGITGIVDDDCSEFKRQIKQNFKYEVAEYTIEKIMNKTNGEDDPVDQETIQDIDNQISNEQAGISENDDGSQSSDEENDDEKKKKKEEDPRKTLKKFTDAGIANLLLPSDADLSSNIVSENGLPSDLSSGSVFTPIRTDFKDMDTMELDSIGANGWSSSLVTDAEAITYAGQYFNCLTDKRYDDTYLNLEMEYILAGEKDDNANYKKVVDEILMVRFGFNTAYILTDVTKMARCEALAAAISSAAPIMQPVVKFLLAGCWAYIESVADVYRLVRNHKVPYIKTSETWLTDFNSLSNLESLSNGSADEEEGLGYKEYLMILMALTGKEKYYRMLDLMQMNANHNSTSSYRIGIKDCITAFGIDAEIVYDGRTFALHEEAGY
ncbi:MAG: hypothetical protein IKS48_07190 [Eubacterium sp.]|nr:hypothetical protein [Eubacterium sp.]